MKSLTITNKSFRNHLRNAQAIDILNHIVASYDELRKRFPEPDTLDYFINLAAIYKAKTFKQHNKKAS